MFLDEKDIKLIVNIIDWALDDGYGDIRGYDDVLRILKRMLHEVSFDEDILKYFNERYSI